MNRLLTVVALLGVVVTATAAGREARIVPVSAPTLAVGQLPAQPHAHSAIRHVTRPAVSAARPAGGAHVAARIAPRTPAHQRRDVLRVGTRNRVVLIDLPALPAVHTPVAAVIVLHGLNGTPGPLRDILGFTAPANSAGVVVAYPYGLGESWNSGTCCGAAAAGHVDDTGFLDALRAHLVHHLGVDPHRIALVGFSNGGMMAFAYACVRPGAAVAVVGLAATLTRTCRVIRGRHPAVLLVRGSGDTRVPAGGGHSAYLNANLRNTDVSAQLVAGGHCHVVSRVRNGAGDVTTADRCAGGTATITVVAGAGHLIVASLPGHVHVGHLSWRFVASALGVS